MLDREELISNLVSMSRYKDLYEKSQKELKQLETKHEEELEHSQALLSESAAEIEELTDERDQYCEQVERLEEEVEDMEDRIVGLDDKVEELTEAMSAMKKEAEEMNADGWKIIEQNRLEKDKYERKLKKAESQSSEFAQMIENLPNDMEEYSWDIKQVRWVHQDESSEEEEEEEESWYGPHRICAGRSGESSEEVEMSADEWKTIDAELDRVARTMWDDKESA